MEELRGWEEGRKAVSSRFNAALPRFNGPLAQFKVQCGFAAVQGSLT